MKYYHIITTNGGWEFSEFLYAFKSKPSHKDVEMLVYEIAANEADELEHFCLSDEELEDDEARREFFDEVCGGIRYEEISEEEARRMVEEEGFEVEYYDD